MHEDPQESSGLLPAPAAHAEVRMRCTYHCSSCGLHLHSLQAFDAHRVGSYAEGRRCEHSLDLLDKHGRPLLVPLTEEGVCAIGRNTLEPLNGVSVWVDARSHERVAQRFSRAESGPLELTGALA